MAVDGWRRIDVSDWPSRPEQSGTSEVAWLTDPDTENHWLHKDTVIPANGVEQGEDWSEVASTKAAELLGVPCAETRLCVRDGRRGSLSLSIKPKGYDLWEGWVALEDAGVPGYVRHVEGRPPACDPARPGVKRPGHSLENIQRALRGATPPPGFKGPGEMTAFDVFAGYLVFDALVANPDRHERNWAILAPLLTTNRPTLAPSYDHASTLGYNLPDSKRQNCVEDVASLEKWASRGRAQRFEHVGKPPTLVDTAARAISMCSSTGAQWWRDRLRAVALSPLQDELRDRVVPDMSDLAVTFAVALLDLNLRRLRYVISDCA
jgi:hypothetical protein